MMGLLKKLPPWLLLLLCALYVLSPVDLLPDFLGVPGRLDDLLLALGTLFYLYSASKRVPGTGDSASERASREGRRGHQDARGSEKAHSARAARESVDPYEVLGVDRGQGFEAIRSRYKEKLLQYHPDRVQHLGKEFEEMAERKTKEITEAYQQILRERGSRS
jgi:hypothetical protein